MQKNPKHKIALVAGIILFAATPFVFFLSPEIIFHPLLCIPEDAYELFACAGRIYPASLLLSTIVFIVGVVLILWALHISSRKK